jgi:phosphoglycolate phosphatase-like HAD superfamily hydrolase
MERIEGLLLEPVGCLAEFPPGPFHEIAVRFFGRKGKASPSASRSYWHLLNLMEAGQGTSTSEDAAPLSAEARSIVESLEVEAVEAASLYEDVAPVLAELKSMGVSLLIASSLSDAAVRRFVEKNSLGEFFPGVWSRDHAGGIAAGIKAAPLTAALHAASLSPGGTIFLTDTVEGINVARIAGVHPILMMNNPDEAQRLSAYNPAGGVVSLHEIPDFIRLVAAQNIRA